MAQWFETNSKPKWQCFGFDSCLRAVPAKGILPSTQLKNCPAPCPFAPAHPIDRDPVHARQEPSSKLTEALPGPYDAMLTSRTESAVWENPDGGTVWKNPAEANTRFIFIDASPHVHPRRAHDGCRVASPPSALPWRRRCCGGPGKAAT